MRETFTLIIIGITIIALSLGLTYIISSGKTIIDLPTISELQQMTRQEIGALDISTCPPADVVWMLLKRIEELENHKLQSLSRR